MRRLWRDVIELNREIKELFDRAESEEALASEQLAISACEFSTKAREVVDDKLSFSATLMRAGEVAAANRLLAEVENEVREEEVALLERVNEVKVSQAIKRERMTRLRLARTLAVALLGSVILSASAIGVTLAGVIADQTTQAPLARERVGKALGRTTPKATMKSRNSNRKRVHVAGRQFILTATEARAFHALRNGDFESTEVQQLLGMLPPQVAEAITAAANLVPEEVVAVTEEAAELPRVPKDKVKKEEAAADPSPSPSESPKDETKDDGKQSSGDGSHSPDDEDEDGQEGLPNPLDD